jgi:DNA gyrase subunit A
MNLGEDNTLLAIARNAEESEDEGIEETGDVEESDG